MAKYNIIYTEYPSGVTRKEIDFPISGLILSEKDVEEMKKALTKKYNLRKITILNYEIQMEENNV